MGRGRREIAQGKHRQYYVHRSKSGRFQKWTPRGASHKADRRKYVPKKGIKSGYGHLGDRPRRRK